MEDAGYYRAQADRYRRMLKSVDDPRAREVLAGLISEAAAKAGTGETDAPGSSGLRPRSRFKTLER